MLLDIGPTRNELPPSIGGREDFPPYYRLLINWIAGHTDHAKFQHLDTKNPDGHHTAQKIVLVEALASSQELAQLTKDCPNAVGMATNAENPTAAAKVLLDARREIYLSSLCLQGYLAHKKQPSPRTTIGP